MQKTIKLTLVGGLLMAFLTACGPTEVVETPSAKVPATEEKEDVGFELVEMDERFVSYTGEVTVSGEYKFYGNTGFLSGSLCFEVDKETAHLIPRGEDDERDPWFCFAEEDQKEVAQILGIDTANVLSDANIEYVHGKATVRISEYIVDRLPSEVNDIATFEAMISNEAPVEKKLVDATNDQFPEAE